MLTLILLTAVVGVICWAVTTYVPMAEPFPKFVILAGVVIVLLLWLQAFGLIGALDQPVPRLR